MKNTSLFVGYPALGRAGVRRCAFEFLIFSCLKNNGRLLLPLRESGSLPFLFQTFFAAAATF